MIEHVTAVCVYSGGLAIYISDTCDFFHVGLGLFQQLPVSSGGKGDGWFKTSHKS